VTLRVTGLEFTSLAEGEDIEKLPRGPANAPGMVDEVEVEVGGGVNEIVGDAVGKDRVGVGEAVDKEFSP
jgi:hypothetical protein